MTHFHHPPVQVLPITGLPEIGPGQDLPALFGPLLVGLALPGDVLIVTQKIVSKAEDRYVALETVVPSAAAIALARKVRKDPKLVELVLRESVAVVRAVPHVLITRHRSGHVMANAGIDQSNIGVDKGLRVLLLPQDADNSARSLAVALTDRLGWSLPIVISDSFGRPWRVGVVNVAIGASGLAAVVDHRGRPDRDGRPLEVTQVASADLLAAAAGLVMGEVDEGVPAALIRGARWRASSDGASALLRPLEEDLFR